MKKEIGVIIPTWQGEKTLDACLAPLVASEEAACILVIDSSSTDATLSIAKRYAPYVETMVIPKGEFGHGRTREYARRLLGTPICAMLTQDVVPNSPDLLSRLTAPIREGFAAVSYARQIPRRECSRVEQILRETIYPRESHTRSLSDAARYGSYLFFCSNACAAYDQALLDEAGGFPDVQINEEAVIVAKLLREGHSIAYVAESEVIHSHDHSLYEMFRRQLAIGCVRRRYKELLDCGECDERLGWRLIVEIGQKLGYNSPELLPSAFIELLIKWLGYRIGRLKARIPI